MSERLVGRQLLAAALLSLVLRVWLSGLFELSPDEALYVTWAWGRPGVDHPPLLVWALRAALRAPLSLERATRLVPALCALGTWWCLDGLLVAWKAHARARWALLLAGLLPLPATGALIATPDGPMVLFTALALRGALQVGEARAWGWVLAPAAALAVLSKAQALWLLPALAVCAPREARGALLLALASQMAVLPQALPSLRFQLVHAFTAQGPAEGLAAPTRFPLEGVLAFLGGQVALLLPGLPWVRLREASTREGALALAVLVSVAPVLVSGLVRIPEPSWSAPAMPMVMLLLALGSARVDRRRWAAGGALVVVAAAVLHLQAARPVLPLPARADPTSRLRGWRAVVCDGATHPWRPLPPYALAAERAVYGGRCGR
ncbi:MAG: glycosyltransferase family 39 protein [Deltaproteobacteria bacterium]|nr:glycosyltransferase family 39 protein [Deltaproteobacteria bacterium]